MANQENGLGQGIRAAVSSIREATHRPTAEEKAARENMLDGYAFEVIAELGESEWFRIENRIDELHPLPQPGRFLGRGTNATPKEMMEVLNRLEAGGLVVSYPKKEDPNKPRFTTRKIILWNIAPDETPQTVSVPATQ